MRSRRVGPVTTGFSVVLAVAALVFCAFAIPPRTAQAATVERGVVDNRLEYSGRVQIDQVDAYADEVAATGAKWTRIFVRWNYLQPKAPGKVLATDANGDGYDDGYVAELEAVVKALHVRGVRVIFCANDIPKWAANPRYIKDHPTSAVIRTDTTRSLTQFQRFAKFLAGHFAGPDYDVKHFEVWNEPNLAAGIYPQIVGKTAVGPAAYLKMVRAFWNGARSANRQAVIIAGGTSRFGSNGRDMGSVSPQWFAAYLKAHGAGKYFNAYSHHPYTKLGSDPDPSVPPKEPKKAVTLGNIDVLLKIFPTKDFYLTEFCYSTAPVRDLFCVVVSKPDQAAYLTKAWNWVARYPKIKVMLWFLVRDWEKDPVATPGVGVYTGLLEANGTRKPSWYAFVDRNTLTAAASVAAGTAFDITGRLSTKDALSVDVGDPAVRLILQRRALVDGSWADVDTTDTDANGDYTFTVSQAQGWQYRVVFDGVCQSAPVTVDVL